MIKFINNAGSSKAKISNTVEELPTTGKEKDLAVVYREEIQPFQESTQTQVITFPDTVVLDEAFTGNVRGMLRSVDPSKMFDGKVMLDPNMFRFDGFGETEMIRVEYRSTDGTTYTRERMEPDTTPIDLGTQIKWEPMEPFNPVVGKFMQVGGNTFEGLFEFTSFLDKHNVVIPKFQDYTLENGLSCKLNDFFGSYDFSKILKLYTEIKTENRVMDNWSLLYINNKLAIGYVNANVNGNDIRSAVNLYAPDGIVVTNAHSGSYNNQYTIKDVYIRYYTLDLDNLTYSQQPDLMPNEEYVVSKTNVKRFYWSASVVQAVGGAYNNSNQTSLSVFSTSSGYALTTTDNLNAYRPASEYVYAPTQLTLQQPNQLLPGVIGYGKNGEITGDESIYSNINVTEMLENLGISPYNNSLVLANEGTHIIPCNQYDAGVEIINYLGVLKTNFKPNSNIQKRSIYLVGDYIMIFNPNGIAYWYDMNLNLIASHKGEGSASSIQVKSVFTDSNKCFFSTQNYNDTNNVDIYSIDKNGITSNKTYTVEGKLNYAIMSDGIIYAVSTNSNHIFLYKLLETGEAELVLSQDTTSQVYDAELFQDENYIYVTATNFAQYSFYNKKDNTSGFKTFNYSVSLYQGLDNRIYLAELSKFSKLEGSNIEEVTVPFFPSNVSMGIYDLSKNTIISYSGVTNMEPRQILLYNSENSGHQVVPNLSDNKNRLSTFRGKFNGSKFIGIRTEAAFTQDTQEYRIYSSEITFDKKVIQEYQLNAIPILKLNDLSNLHLALGNIGNYTF